MAELSWTFLILLAKAGYAALRFPAIMKEAQGTFPLELKLWYSNPQFGINMGLSRIDLQQ